MRNLSTMPYIGCALEKLRACSSLKKGPRSVYVYSPRCYCDFSVHHENTATLCHCKGRTLSFVCAEELLFPSEHLQALAGQGHTSEPIITTSDSMLVNFLAATDDSDLSLTLVTYQWE